MIPGPPRPVLKLQQLLTLSHRLPHRLAPMRAGAANAGVPLAAIVQNYGWDVYFGALIASCVITVLLILPMARLKSYSQTVAKTE